MEQVSSFDNIKNQKIIKILLRNKGLFFGFSFLIILLVFTVFPWVFFDKTEIILTNSDARFLAPSSDYWFGSDHLGRDIFSRVVWGTQISLGISVGSMLLALIVGGGFGLMSGYFGGLLDMICGRIVDVLFSFPSQILAIFIAGILGAGVFNVMLAIGIVFTPVFFRQMRSSVIKEKEEEYVQAGIALGMSRMYVLFVHILRNSIGPVTVQFTVGLAVAIQLEAALGFLGLGVQPPASSWGSILNDGIDYLIKAPWISILPGLFMVLAVFTFNLIGDNLRDIYDPNSRK